jgi:hypothetical protein
VSRDPSPKSSRGEGRSRARQTLLLLLSVIPLTRCECELPGSFDAGVYACTLNADCSPGFACIAQRCLPVGTPPPDSGSAGGGQTDFTAALHFTSPARTVAVGDCSPAVTFGFVDDAGQPVTSPTDVEVTASALDLSLFSDATCLTGQGTFPVRSEGTLHFRGARAGMFTIRLTGTSLEPATQTQTVGQLPRLAFTSTRRRRRSREPACRGSPSSCATRPAHRCRRPAEASRST